MPSMRWLPLPCLVVTLALLVLAGPAAAHDAHARVAAAQDTSEPCPGEPLRQPDRVLKGQFGSEREGSYVFLPVRVPRTVTALRVKYCYDQPENAPPGSTERHTLDLGLYEPRDTLRRPWGTDEFRGWGGSSHPDVTLSPQGYSSARQYREDPRGYVPGRTTRAFEPGGIPPGKWGVELGLASIVSEEGGDEDGRVAYRVEVDWKRNPTFDDDRYRPKPYDQSPADSDPGWYAGDLHVHGEHSALGDAPMREVFDYAFGSLEAGMAGLDFITLSDYVSGSSWDEVGRYQDDYPGSLIARSAEVITYRGHANSHANTAVVDYRTGRVYKRKRAGGLRLLRDARPASMLFDRILGAGGFTQINHPTIFPSAAFGSLCRGCPWDYSDRQTDYSKVDAIEIATGPDGADEAPGEPGPNPFTVTAIQFWEEALDQGFKIAAVGSSDSHNAGRTPDPVTQAPIGTATTVVRAPELSEAGIERGVRAGHTYVKVTGNDAPDLRFSAHRAGSGDWLGIMGDTVRAGQVELRARVIGGAPDPPAEGYTLELRKDGSPLPIFTLPVDDDDFSYSFPAIGEGRYRLQLQRGSTIEAVSSPIYVEAP